MTAREAGDVRVPRSRSGRPDLLQRPPTSVDADQGWLAMIVDPIDQIEALSELRQRGLLTEEEFNRQKDKLLP
jgi:hypothetical protein